MQEEKILIFK